MQLTAQQEERYLTELAPQLAELEDEASAYRAEGWSAENGAVEVQPHRDGKHQVVAALHLSRPLPDQARTPSALGRASPQSARAVELEHDCRRAVFERVPAQGGTPARWRKVNGWRPSRDLD